MLYRIATLLLVMLTIGFFAYHKAQNFNQPSIQAFTQVEKSDEVIIAQDEFLILMDQGDEKYLNDVLADFDLRMISPLGEWIHVKKNNARDLVEITPISSPKAQENLVLVENLEAHPAVHSAHVNYIQEDTWFACTPPWNKTDDVKNARHIIPTDPYFRLQWHLSREQGINLPAAWSITTGNKNTVIALVDRNFDFLQSDLSPERCSSRRYYYENVLDYFKNRNTALADDTRHGAYVMGVLAPCTDNSVGLAGVDWHAQIFGIDTKSDASLSARMFGILWAAGMDVCQSSIVSCKNPERVQKNVHKANVINASFGFAGPYLSDPPYGPILDVIGRVNREGRIIVASAGNEGGLADRRLPGSAGGVISVGASNEKKQSTYFSNFGRTVDVVAPGENILSLSNGELISLNGTSFSSPLVAGIVSLMLAKNPLLSWKHAEYFLKTTASKFRCDDYCPKTMSKASQKYCKDYCCDGDQVVCAHGIVNAYEAVAMASKGIPNIALVDIDDYYLPLSKDNNLQIRVAVKNWGKKSAHVRMKKTNKHLHIKPEKLIVAPIDDNGIPGTQDIVVFHDEWPRENTVSSLILEAASASEPLVYNDRIEAIVEIVPDNVTGKTPRILRELLPK